MGAYIALLRGINVGGHKKILMEHLRTVFESLTLSNVRTYIQSGNVLFESAETDAVSLADRIERGLEQEYGFKIPVVLRTPDQLEATVRRNPFDMTGRPSSDSLYVSFLKEIPSAQAIADCYSFRNDVDEFIVDGAEVYILIHKHYGESKFSNNFLEKKLKVAATTRNWATVNKLIAMTKE